MASPATFGVHLGEPEIKHKPTGNLIRASWQEMSKPAEHEAESTTKHYEAGVVEYDSGRPSWMAGWWTVGSSYEGALCTSQPEVHRHSSGQLISWPLIGTLQFTSHPSCRTQLQVLVLYRVTRQLCGCSYHHIGDKQAEEQRPASKQVASTLLSSPQCQVASLDGQWQGWEDGKPEFSAVLP